MIERHEIPVIFKVQRDDKDNYVYEIDVGYVKLRFLQTLGKIDVARIVNIYYAGTNNFTVEMEYE